MGKPRRGLQYALLEILVISMRPMVVGFDGEPYTRKDGTKLIGSCSRMLGTNQSLGRILRFGPKDLKKKKSVDGLAMTGQ